MTRASRGTRSALQPGGDAARLMPSAAELYRLRAVAAGEAEADLVIRGGVVLVVQTGEALRRDILIAGRHIAAVTQPGALTARRSLDAAGRHVLPAYVDARVRLEQTLLTPGELARLVVPRGTVTMLAHPGRLEGMCGPAGSGLLTRTDTPVRVLMPAATSWPANLDEAVRGNAAEEDGVEPASTPSAPPTSAVVPAVPAVSAAVPTAPIVHPAATGTPGVAAATPGGAGTPPSTPAATDLLTLGHPDQLVRDAVRAGAHPVAAVRRATLVPARLFGLDHVLGSLSHARLADLQIVTDLTEVAPPDLVIAGGRIAAERGRALFDNHDGRPVWALGSVRLPPGLHPGTFTSPCMRWPGRRDRSLTALEVPADGTGAHPRPVRVEPTVVDGTVVADPIRDLLKIAILDRSGRPDGVRVGIVRGIGLTRGALGVTAARAPGELTIVGAHDDDMATAAHALDGMGGGFVVVDRGWVRAACPLPIAGLFSDAPWEAVLGELVAVDTAASDLGCRLPSPLRALAEMGAQLYTCP